MIVRTLWANLAIQVMTFATSVLIARTLGPIGRGELALVLLYPQLVANIAFLGVDRAVAVLSGRGELALPIIMIVKLVLLFSVPAMVAGYVTVSWRVADAHLVELATMYLIYVPAMYFFLLVVSLFNGTGDFARFNQVRLGFYAINFVAVFAIWAVHSTTDLHLDWMVIANLLSVYGALALAVWLLRGYTQTVDSSVIGARKGDVRAVLGLATVFALPVVLAHVSNSAYLIALEHLMGVGALGFFVVFFSYSRLLSPLGSAVGAHVFRFGIAGEKRDIARIFRMSLLVYLGCTLPLWLIADWLIPFIFGQDFVVDNGTVGMLFVSCLFALLADSMAEFLNGQKKVAADIAGRITYLVTLAVLGAWLVPSLGLIGMASAMAVGDMLRCVYLVSRVSCNTERAAGEFWCVTRVDISDLLHVCKRALHGIFVWR